MCTFFPCRLLHSGSSWIKASSFRQEQSGETGIGNDALFPELSLSAVERDW